MLEFFSWVYILQNVILVMNAHIRQYSQIWHDICKCVNMMYVSVGTVD